MFKKICLIFLVLFFILNTNSIYANEQDDLEKRLEELGKAKNTLSNQIKLIESQYQLTLLKISQTEKSIKTLEKEIDQLSVEISKLEIEINQLSKIYINQIIQNYKLQKRIPSFAYLFTSNINSFLSQYQYISSMQKNSQNSLINMETIRSNYDRQKTAKEKKQTELETLKKTLATQKNNLNSQKVAKDQLLKITEVEYQNIQEQLIALRSFSNSAGGSSCLETSPGLGSDGNFYSQRDPRWCKKYIGLSNDTVGSVGCYISSISMVYKKIGSDITPLSYASNPSNFEGNTAWMSAPTPPSGYFYKCLSIYNKSGCEKTSLNNIYNRIDNELKNGRYAILQMKMSNIAGMHFIVVISGSNGNYKIHDPWFGADLNFSDRYSSSLIMSLRLITK